MKNIKTYIFLIFLCAGAGLCAQPQQHVIDHSFGNSQGAKTTTVYPFNGGMITYKTYRSQVFYRAAWLKPLFGSRISKITFHIAASSSADFDFNTQFVTKLMTTSAVGLKDRFASSDGKTPEAVYEGNMSYTNRTLEITFDTPLKYLGGSLAVDFVKKTRDGNGYAPSFESGGVVYDGDPYDQEWRQIDENLVSRAEYLSGIGTEKEEKITSPRFPKITFTYTPFVYYKLASSVTEGGSINTLDTVFVEEDYDYTYTFTPDETYRVEEVLVDGVNHPEAVSSGSYTFENVNAAHHIEVVFDLIPYDITTSIGSGKGTISPGGTSTIRHGGSDTFFFAPDTGYSLVDVRIDGISNAAAVENGFYAFTDVTAHHTISAWFVLKKYTLTPILNSGHGTIMPSTAITLEHGSDQYFEFKPDLGYKIAQVLIDGVNNEEAVNQGYYTFEKIKGPHTIEAVFEIKKFAITAAIDGGNGTISPPGETLTDFGSSPVYAISAADNFYISRLLIDGVENTDAVGERFYVYNFSNVRETHEIRVSFAEIQKVTITASVDGSNGSITPNGEIQIQNGTSQMFSIASDPNYVISKLWIDNEELTDAANERFYVYNFTNVTSNRSIRVAFAQTSATADFTEEKALNVYPNPTRDILHIQTEQIIQQIFVLDAQGKVWQHWQGNHQTIDLQSIPSGNYILRIHTENAVISKKIVKR